MATRREPWFEWAGRETRKIKDGVSGAASKTAAGLSKAARKAASGIADVAVRTPAEYYAERAREFQRGYSPEIPAPQPNAADEARSSARAQMFARGNAAATRPAEAAAATPAPADPQAARRLPVGIIREPSAVSAQRVVRDSHGNTMTVSGTGRSSGYYDPAGGRRYVRNIRVRQEGPFSPDYSTHSSGPQSLSDIAASARTVGDLVRIRPLMRAAEIDRKNLLQQQGLEQEALAGKEDRALRGRQIASGERQAAEDIGLRRQQMALGASQAAEETGLRRQQMEQQGAYQQGVLELQQEDVAIKQAEAAAERNAEAARQKRLNVALSIYDNPESPPELKQRARRIIEANQGKASFDLGEKPMTQEDAQKSLQDTWRAVAGNDVPLDPTSTEQLQGVAQANPAAWRAVNGKATPEMVQRYNVLSRLPDTEIAKDPMIASLIKNNGGGETPEEARVILEALIKKQRGF